MKKETRYFTNWNYNAARILSRLADIVEENGGYIAETNAPDYFYHSFDTLYTIHNRTLHAAIREQEERVNRLKELNRNYKPVKKELDELRAINAPAIETRFTSWIHFMLDGIYYELSFDCNPFFPFHYRKVKTENNKYSGEYYCEELKKDWLFDCFFSFHCSESDINQGAKLVFDELRAAPVAKEYIERKKTRVPNLYDGGYHYETITTRNKKTTTIYKAKDIENV